MNAPSDSTAANGPGGWWASPPRSGLERLISPWEYRHLRFFGAAPRFRRHCRGWRGHRVPRVPRLRMGSLLRGYRGGEYRGRLWYLTIDRSHLAQT